MKIYSTTKKFSIFLLLILSSCATFKQQQGAISSTKNQLIPTHSFFVAGGLGNYEEDIPTDLLDELKNQ